MVTAEKETEVKSDFGVVYNSHYDNCRFKGGSVSLQVYGHGDDTSGCVTELTKKLNLWKNRFNEYSNKGDEEGKKFAAGYIESKKKALASVRVIKKSEYQKELDAVILQEAEEITEDDYWEMLECLPPKKMGQNYFIMSEFFTGSYTSQFYKKDGKFYHKMIDYKRPETWAQL